MNFKTLIFCTLFSASLVLLLSSTVSAIEYRKVDSEIKAEDILKQIENETDIYLENCSIVGELDLSEVNLETIPNPKFKPYLEDYGVSEELKIIESNIIIKNSIFKNDIDFSNVLFNNSSQFKRTHFDSANFMGASFNNSAYFRKASFNNSAYFTEANFNGANFGGANFSNSANFERTSFNKSAYFREVNFSNSANFVGVSFNNSAHFTEANFSNSTYFTEANFNDAYFWNASFNDANFERANFNDADFKDSSFKDANFKYANFHDANFGWVNFSNLVIFCGASFNDAYFGRANFNDAYLGADYNNYACFERANFSAFADFWGANFYDYANFEGANFNVARFEGVDFYDANFIGTNFDYNAHFERVNFNNYANFGKANFSDYANFEGADFNGANFGGTNFYNSANFWGADFSDTTELVGPYTPDNLILDGKNSQIFMKYYKNQGQYEVADTVYYNYRKECQKRKGWYELSKWTDLITQGACGYGVRPSHTLVFGFIVVILFGFIYAKWPSISLDKHENKKIPLRFYFKGPGICRLAKKDENDSQVVSWKDALYFSLTTFTTVGYGDWYPEDNMRKWATLEGLLGWITLGIFMATLTIVLIRI